MSKSHKCAEVETRYLKMGGLFLYGTGQRAAGSIHFSRRKTLTRCRPKQNITSLYLRHSTDTYCRSKTRCPKRRPNIMQNSTVYDSSGSSIVLASKGYESEMKVSYTLCRMSVVKRECIFRDLD
jgi:hypothetical protein